ncbi:hypothetical protein M419DRAFT_124379 [Trichoderma reesei RUT C-30]|uniref:Uncharacterized protein n=1 Tax=Hypocrea jecorina (strain ATCC 56765 / BCRC 32924 / NRRL 11460 / Rut C-30) TaxID=1344414 RepID=A0A024S2G3_HYPJR|nr:hypothetical protein M419DRAFT_124379 [Trichoderma reesei RUT C-30]
MLKDLELAPFPRYKSQPYEISHGSLVNPRNLASFPRASGVFRAIISFALYRPYNS